MTLFDTDYPDLKNDVIRSIGLYQPFASRMLHGKIETRWVMEGRKPSFPPGWYVVYSTQKSCTDEMLLEWGYPDQHSEAWENDKTKNLNGYAIGIGRLTGWEPLTANHKNTYIKFIGKKLFLVKGRKVVKVQWAGRFDVVYPIEPIMWKGTQGPAFVTDQQREKIKLLK